MSKHATFPAQGASAHVPSALRLVEPASPQRAADRPLLDWTPLGPGRWSANAAGRNVTLSPLPTGQAVRLLEVDGTFHLLTGKVGDDRAMQVVAETLASGF